MHYIDRVYGEFEISEPVILELIKSHSIQRLKGVDSAGYQEPHFPGTSRSRFAHSMGVYLLLKKYHAPLEEQIAGLIHDVSHSAFSHCIDYALEGGSGAKQSHQDNVFDEFVKKSEIPAILQKHNLDVDYILNDQDFPLKEKGLPDLCADRIDYSLEWAVIGEKLNREQINYFLENLIAENGHWIFKNFESAKKFAELFLHLNTKYLSGIASAVMFRTVGDYLCHALKNSYITLDNLYTTDQEVMTKINTRLIDDTQLRLFWDRMNLKIGYKNDPKNYDAQAFCKSRAVDPLCYHQGKIVKVSMIDSRWAQILEQESKPKEYFIKFEK